ncbi:hypothetical protein WJX72_001348 [[Myrmecia] bisecta]|uniref:CobW/HypB/UreG nucleotide-binding domain-containing protein n=1 Tax=[Myrmecia] bisecta TaxID=41462 RepID=A0AAW1Q082_9CHLO
MKLPIPVNIVTGALGVGKTTAIAELLKHKPAVEHWAVVVNEFGEVGIDQAVIEGSTTGDQRSAGFTVREMAGGCMCCTLSGPVGAAIATLVRRVKPDRLVIEPSGLGHPAGLLDLLAGQHLRTALDLKAVICLVEPSQVADPQSVFHQHALFKDQVSVADILIASKTDLASPRALQHFEAWAQQLYPPKMRVETATRGSFALALLDVPRTPLLLPMSTAASMSGSGGSFRQAAQIGVYHSCGWIFSPDDVFNKQHLLHMLAAVQSTVVRVKGVFRVGKDWVIPATNSAGELVLEPIAYCRDSRIEIIAAPTAPAKTLDCLDQEAFLESAQSHQPDCTSSRSSADSTPIVSVQDMELVRAIKLHRWSTVESHLLSLLPRQPG